MKYRNKALIYEVDDDRVSLDEGFNGYLEKNDYILIDIHTLGEEIANELLEDNNEMYFSELDKEIDNVLNPIKDHLIDEIIDYTERNDGTIHM